MKAYLAMWKNLGDFAGRTSVSGYWLAVLGNIIVTVVLEIPYLVTQNAVLMIPVLLYGLAAIVPGLALTVRRLHDTGRSGRWIFIAFVPFIGSIWLLVLMLMPGEAGSNAYGANPAAKAVPVA